MAGQLLFAGFWLFASFVFGYAAQIPYLEHGMIEPMMRICFDILSLTSAVFATMPVFAEQPSAEVEVVEYTALGTAQICAAVKANPTISTCKPWKIGG